MLPHVAHIFRDNLLGRPHLFHTLFRRVKDHYSLQQYSQCLKNPCIGQVVLYKWFPLSFARGWAAARSSESAATGATPNLPTKIILTKTA